MRWGDMGQSSNVEDRTGMGQAGGRRGGGGMRLGLGGIVIAVIASLIFGINPLQFLGMMETSAPPPPSAPAPAPGSAGGQAAAPVTEEKKMLSAVLRDTENVWTAVFRTPYVNQQYVPPKLVLYTGAVRSACGGASAAVGPFYCPADQKLYLDTSFFNELEQRFRAPGDFAQAYVVAHEIGHHVQNMLGTMDQFDAMSKRVGERERNALSIRLELQADCYAGVWGYYAKARNLLEPGDLEEGLRAAAAVGDDQIQRRTQGTIRPESFTHGSADQRQRWFKRGVDSGDLRTCDTFKAAQL